MSETAWREALHAMRRGDLGPIAKLISSTSPIPPWIREELGRMLDPDTNPEEYDRLIFSRSERLAKEVKKNQDKIALGMVVLDRINAGGRDGVPKNAISDVANERGLSERYVKASLALAKRLDSYYRPFARSTLAAFSPHRTGRKARK